VPYSIPGMISFGKEFYYVTYLLPDDFQNQISLSEIMKTVRKRIFNIKIVRLKI
jgi:hypothetical protein